uniref:Poly(A) RNA polymerase mitochondrial-like central palm domain-containing protein n=1 Tax=Schistocephalus solidus TaxID=70667 RepID=A0A0X3NN82_SCHSO
MNLEQYLILARRCACFSVAPASLAQALTLLSQASANLERAFYWNKGCGGGGMLLVQSASHDSLSRALQSLYLYPRHFFSLSQYQSKMPLDNSKRFSLPPYRVCSDPSIWPASASVALRPPREFEKLLCFQSDPISPSALERALLQQHSLVKQMQFLVSSTLLLPPARLARFVFADSLQEMLAKIRPGTTVYPFGSAINGLGSVTSDLDLSIEMGIDVVPELKSLAEYHRLQVTADVSWKGNDILGGLLRFSGQTSYKLLTPIRFLLNRLDPLSAPSSRVLPGHVPIINYSRHRALGLGVDISRSVEGERSSQVVLRAAHWMRSLVQQVPIFIFLAYALKYIARAAHVTHHGPAFGITSYKLTVILVHFLQAIGYAPPLEYLLLHDMRPVDVAQRIFIPLEEDPTCPPEAADVFNEFLTYLLALNPPAVTLCLRSGRLIPRLDSNAHFIHCPNPLFPDRNITRGIDAATWSNFLDIVTHAQTILSSVATPSSSKTLLWGLPAIAQPPSTAVS